jgi:hypothetical protein
MRGTALSLASSGSRSVMSLQFQYEKDIFKQNNIIFLSQKNRVDGTELNSHHRDMRAPQVIFIILCTVDVMIHLFKHGDERPKYNFFVKVADTFLLTALLFWGGFFAA